MARSAASPSSRNEFRGVRRPHVAAVGARVKRSLTPPPGRSTNLGAQLTFGPLASNIVGQAGTSVFTDTNAVGKGPFFYRVGLQE